MADLEKQRPTSDPVASSGPVESAGHQRDTTADERDVASGRRDQTALLRDQIGDTRDSAAQTRSDAATFRDEAGGERDRAAALRDEAAAVRDQTADQLCLAAAERDETAEQRHDWRGERTAAESRADLLLAHEWAVLDRARASSERLAGARDRKHAQLDRQAALLDRTEGALERDRAELDRESAVADRVTSYRERLRGELDRNAAMGDRESASADRAFAAVDGLTGVYLRQTGLGLLDQEISRALRNKTPLTLAFVDVDGLKAVNDSQGHGMGDQLLAATAAALTQVLRSYDVVFRYGGDEFVCVLSDVATADAIVRLEQVNVVLAATSPAGSISFGLAELRADDAAADLIARADAALYGQRRLARA